MAQRTAEQIQELLTDYRNRGEMTRRGFCESRGISLPTLDYYLRRYGKSTPAPAAAKLMRVKVEPAEEPAPCHFTLVLRNGRRIESAWNFADAELARLIRVVEAA